MAEIGLINGLAANLGYNDRINDLRYREEQNKRALAESQAKSALFAQDLDYQNAANSYDNPRIKEYSQGQIKKIGQFVRENPDWSTNVDKRLQLNLLKHDLKDNVHVRRGMASDAAYRELLKDKAEVAKNPLQHDVEAYNDLDKQWQNYNQYGNQYGEQAAKQQGAQAFVYTKPQDFTELDKSGQQVGNRFKGSAMEIEYLKNGRDGAYITKPKSALLDAAAKQEYLEHKRQYDVQYTNKGQDPIAAAKNFIMSGVDTKFDIGQKNTLGDELYKIKFKHDLDAANSGGQSRFDLAVKAPGYASPPGEDLAKAFGSSPAAFFVDGTGKPVPIQGNVFNYKGDIYDEGYRKDGKYPKTGVKIADGFVYMPLQWGKDNGYTHDPWLDGKDDVVKPENARSMEIVDSPPDREGNSHKLIRVNAHARLNANDPHVRGKFDQITETAKQQNSGGISADQLFQDEKGHIFDGNGNFIR